MASPAETILIRSNVKELLLLLKKLKAVMPRNKMAATKVALEMTVKTNEITMAVPGAIFTDYCFTQGTAKVSMAFFHFYDLVKSAKAQTLELEITEGKMRVGGITVPARTWFFDSDRILRSIKLPANYTDLHLLQLRDAYTQEEIEFNKLRGKMTEAEERLERSIKGTGWALSKYNVPEKEIRELVLRWVYGEEEKESFN